MQPSLGASQLPSEHHVALTKVIRPWQQSAVGRPAGWHLTSGAATIARKRFFATPLSQSYLLGFVSRRSVRLQHFAAVLEASHHPLSSILQTSPLQHAIICALVPSGIVICFFWYR
jgi:hypothetical protein